VCIDRTIRDFAGNVYPVSWDAALALRDLGAEFFLLVSNDSPLCDRFEKTLLGFLQHQKLLVYVARVSVAEDPTAAVHLGVTYVPQVRFYRDGEEIGRHRGLASYETFSRLIGLME